MELTNDEVLERYKQDQENFIASLKRTEAVLMVMIKAVYKMAGSDKFWADIGYKHIKEGISALINATSGTPSTETLEKIKLQIISSSEQQDNSPD